MTAASVEDLRLGADIQHYLSETDETVARLSVHTIERDECDASSQAPTEPHDSSTYLSPPISPTWLAYLTDISSILPQCIEALKTGIEGYGYSLPPADGSMSEGLSDAEKDERETEKRRIRRWFDHAAGDLSWQDFRENSRVDEETIGWKAWELLPDMASDYRWAICGMEHVPSRTVRLMPKSRKPIEVTRWRMSEDGSEWEEVKRWKRVRTYVQLGDQGEEAYFKEPGDPRAIDRENGDVLADDEVGYTGDRPLAREMLFTGPYSPKGIYPQPRWVGAIAALMGSFEAEHKNLRWFENPIPLMLLMVAGGMLPNKTQEALAEDIKQARQKSKDPTIIILEAISKGTGGFADLQRSGASLTPSMEVVKLHELQTTDGQFQVFDGNSRAKVRSSCGVPPLFTAESDDYNFASSKAAQQVFEENVCAPARLRQDTIINRQIMPRIDAKWFVYRGNGPSLTSMDDVTKGAEAMAKTGAGTMNDATDLIGKALGVELTRTDQAWGALPFALVQTLANQGLLDVMNEERLEKAVRGVVERVLALAAAGMPGEDGCCG